VFPEFTTLHWHSSFFCFHGFCTLVWSWPNAHKNNVIFTWICSRRSLTLCAAGTKCFPSFHRHLPYSNKHVHCTSEYSWWTWHYILSAFFQVVFSVSVINNSFSLTRPAAKCVMWTDDRWGDQNPQLLILLPETLCAQNCLWCELLLCLAEERRSICHNQTGVQKIVSWQCECMVSGKNCAQIIVALIIHHTPSLTFCNGILWINMVLSALMTSALCIMGRSWWLSCVCKFSKPVDSDSMAVR